MNVNSQDWNEEYEFFVNLSKTLVLVTLVWYTNSVILRGGVFMKKYVSPEMLEVQFHVEDVLAYSIDNPGDEVETPVIPFRLPKVVLGK